MATTKDLLRTTPQDYEVLKLKTGLEIVGMTRDTKQGVEVTLPMICQLRMLPMKRNTLATFYPYAPMTSDTSVVIPFDHLVHRNKMNKQYVPFYDEASSQWFKMIEEGNIPLTNKDPIMSKEYMDQAIKSLIEQTGGPISKREMRDLERFEEFMEENEEEEFDEEYAEFEFAQRPPKEKLH